MVGLLLVMAVLAGAAGMLLLSLFPQAWLGLVVLAGMGGGLGMLALMAASRWRARRLDDDLKRSSGDILRGQSRAYRVYFLSGGLLPAFALTLLAGLILLLAGPRNGSLAFFGAVAGAGTVAFLGALQGLLPRSSKVQDTLALCWKRIPPVWNQPPRTRMANWRGRPPADGPAAGFAGFLSALKHVWDFLSANLSLARRYRKTADKDLRSADPLLPGLTRVLDRRRSGGGGRVPRLVTAGWTAPAADALGRTLALTLMAGLLLPLMLLAARWLPPPGALTMGDQLRRLAYSRQAQGRDPGNFGRQGQESGQSPSPGQAPESSPPQPRADSESRQAGRDGSDHSDRQTQRDSGRQEGAQEGRNQEDSASQGQNRGQQSGEEGARQGDPAGGSGQGSESGSQSAPDDGGGDGRSASSGNGQAGQPRDASSSDGEGRQGQGSSGPTGEGQGEGSAQVGQPGGEKKGSSQGEGTGRGSGSGTQGGQGQGSGSGGNDPEMDFDQPLVEVPELRPEEALELDLPPLDEAASPGDQPAREPGTDRPPPAAASRDRSAGETGQRPENEAAAQRLPNWIRALWDRLAASKPAQDRPAPGGRNSRPQPPKQN